MPEVEQLIARLGLRPLPREGGWFIWSWTSEETLPGAEMTAAWPQFADDIAALTREG